MLLPLNYFGNLPYWNSILTKKCSFCIDDVYIKQSLRNRTTIVSSQGIINLSVPVIRKNGSNTQMKDIKISYDENWQKNHFKSIESSYRSAPFYEFFYAEIKEFYQTKNKWLIDLNLKSISLISKIFQNVLPTISKVRKEISLNEKIDLDRYSSKKISSKYNYPNYTQVFQDKIGFIKNTSVLDAIFCEGPYIKTQIMQ